LLCTGYTLLLKKPGETGGFCVTDDDQGTVAVIPDLGNLNNNSLMQSNFFVMQTFQTQHNHLEETKHLKHGHQSGTSKI
jgi:hypothetical protein